MSKQVFKYEIDETVVNYILTSLNRNQIVGVQAAKDLIAVTQLLQTPLNADDIEKATYNDLKNKFDPVEDKKAKK